MIDAFFGCPSNFVYRMLSVRDFLGNFEYAENMRPLNMHLP